MPMAASSQTSIWTPTTRKRKSHAVTRALCGATVSIILKTWVLLTALLSIADDVCCPATASRCGMATRLSSARHFYAFISSSRERLRGARRREGCARPQVRKTARRPTEKQIHSILADESSREMSFCYECGAKVAPEDPFCGNCGSAQAASPAGVTTNADDETASDAEPSSSNL